MWKTATGLAVSVCCETHFNSHQRNSNKGDNRLAILIKIVISFCASLEISGSYFLIEDLLMNLNQSIHLLMPHNSTSPLLSHIFKTHSCEKELAVYLYIFHPLACHSTPTATSRHTFLAQGGTKSS